MYGNNEEKKNLEREHALHRIKKTNDTSGMRRVMILQTKENDKNEKGSFRKSRATGESEGWRRINRVRCVTVE